jgi:hypothetical protein
MSLLDQATDDVIVFMEEVVTDEDGNIRTRPSKIGTPARIRAQPLGQSGTASRKQEEDVEGYESERVYQIRFPRAWIEKHGEVGSQSQIEWNGQRWALFGTTVRYNSSRKTAHFIYTIKRY